MPANDLAPNVNRWCCPIPDSLSHTSILGTPPSPDSSCHIPATRSPVFLEGSSNAMMNPENAATIVSTGRSAAGRPPTQPGLLDAPPPSTGMTLPGNHRSHCTISPATYTVRSAGSLGAYNGRSSATLALSTEAECLHPTRCAITDAGIVGNCANNSRILGSYPSTSDPTGARSYLGGASEANAARTVFRASPVLRTIALMLNFSDLCSRRISAQSSVMITPSLCRGGQHSIGTRGSGFTRR